MKSEKLPMKNSIFALVCLGLLICLSQAYSSFRFHFGGYKDLEVKSAQLNAALEREKLKTQIANYELSQYQQQVATILPPTNKIRDPEVRSLASVSRPRSAEPIQIDSSAALFSKAQRAFQEKDYTQAISLFESLLRVYPSSIHALKARFLCIESLFQTEEQDKAILLIQEMMELYPEDELTGYALLRLGAIYQGRERFEDAAEVYRTIVATYSHSAQLKEQAQVLLKDVEQ